jgi:hypothetical protein
MFSFYWLDICKFGLQESCPIAPTDSHAGEGMTPNLDPGFFRRLEDTDGLSKRPAKIYNTARI